MTRPTSVLIAAALPFEGLGPATLAALDAAADRMAVAAGQLIYEAGGTADDLYIVQSGTVRLEPPAPAAPERLGPAEAFGWNALGETTGARRKRAVAETDVRMLRLPGATVLEAVTADPESHVAREDIAAAVQALRAPPRAALLAHTLRDVRETLAGREPWLAILGFTLLLGFWYLSVQVLRLPRFAQMPGLTDVLREWFSGNPVYGVSIFTPVYYQHIVVSLRRIFIAFALATVLGVPVGLLLGWSKTFKDYVFPLFEMLRPIPILAWVPLAIIMLPGDELPVIYLTFLASFFATALNTMLGVRSIDANYVLAAQCLGASRWRIFGEVIVPGALPYIFTGLQISMGVAWFSLVAAEMISGQFGLGYLINTSYTTVEYPTLVIAMITLGIVGYGTSALVRLAGNRLMTWRTRQLALEGQR